MRKKGGGRDCLTFGMGSYLAVGLLFGLTLPGVSAHGFLGGRGDGAKGYTPSKKPYQPSSERREGGATDAVREEDGDRSRQIKQEGGRSSVGDTDRGPGGCQTADTPSWLQRLREKPSSILLTRLNTSGS